MRMDIERGGGKAPEFLRTFAVAHRVAGDREAAFHAALQGLALLPQPGPGARPSLIRKLLEEEIR